MGEIVSRWLNMQHSPFVVVIVLWVVTVLLYFLIQWRWPKSNPKHPSQWYTFEQLDTYCDGCNEISGRYGYLLRLIYSRFTKRFFLPNANFSVQMLDNHGRILSDVVISSSMLVTNHRRYMKTKIQDKPLYVLIKRQTPLDNVHSVFLGHNMRGGAIMIRSLMVHDLQTEYVYGSKVDKWIQRIERGCTRDSQCFTYACFGRSRFYVGPSFNITFSVCHQLLSLGLGTILLLFCISKDNPLVGWMVYFDSPSLAFRMSIWTSLVAIAVVWIYIFIYVVVRIIYKRMQPCNRNISLLWLASKVTFYFTYIYFIINSIVIAVLLTSAYRIPAIAKQQKEYWLVSFVIAGVLFLLALALTLQICYLYGLLDEYALPEIEFDSDNITPEYRKMSHDPDSDRIVKSVSECNLLLPSSFVPASSNEQIYPSQVESISKIINTSYTHVTKSCDKKRQSEVQTTHHKSILKALNLVT